MVPIQPDGGKILKDGKRCASQVRIEALEAGIGMVFQEQSLILDLSGHGKHLPRQ